MMNQSDIFKFTAPNGVEVTAVVIANFGSTEDTVSSVYCTFTHYLCYAQRRLFKYTEECFMGENGVVRNFAGYELLVPYAILPEYDELLKESL